MRLKLVLLLFLAAMPAHADDSGVVMPTPQSTTNPAGGLRPSEAMVSTISRQAGPLTIKAAVDLAIARNPDIQYDRERLAEAEEIKKLAVSQVFPVVNGNGSALYKKDSVSTGGVAFGGEAYDVYNANLSLTQPLYRGGAISAGLSYADKEKQLRQYDLDIAERNLASSVVQAFYSVLLNQHLVAILLKTQAVQKESLVTAQRYYRIGREQLIDVLQIQTQLALLAPRIAQADTQMRIAASQLATLLHESDAREIRVEGKLAPIDRAQVARELKISSSRLPEIDKSLLSISQFENSRDVTLSQYWPKLDLVGQVGKSAFTKSDLFDNYSNSWSIGLQLTVPIFAGLASVHQGYQLASQENQLEISNTKLLDQLSFNQVQADKNLSLAESTLDADLEATQLARRSLKEAEKDFRLQTINFLQFLTSEQNYLDAESAYMQAQYNYVTAVASSFVASGVPLDRLITMLVKNTAKEEEY